VDRITKAEDKANLAEASTQRATRSTSSQPQLTLTANTQQTWETKTTQLEKRIAKVEFLTEQFNILSAEPANPATNKLQEKIDNVEKQLHAALGAKHKAGINGSTEPYRIPSMHSLHNYVEGVRRRVKNLEDLEGASDCVATIKQL
jgi:hypothetical protein